MLFPVLDNLNKQDLETAKAFVLSFYNQKEILIDFLIGQEKWRETIYNKYPDLKDCRIDQLEKRPDDELAIDNEFKDILKKETKKLLS